MVAKVAAVTVQRQQCAGGDGGNSGEGIETDDSGLSMDVIETAVAAGPHLTSARKPFARQKLSMQLLRAFALPGT